MDHSSFFSSAQAIRLPCASKHMPLARPAGCRNVESLPSTLHFMMRSLGWSVKKTLPVRVARRAFGELEIAGELLERGAWRGDAGRFLRVTGPRA